MKSGNSKRIMRLQRLRCVLAMVLLASLVGAARANERYESWQADKPYTLAGYGTHDSGGGGKLDINYFLDSGLNTAHDTRNNYNSRRQMVEVGDLPLFYYVYGDPMPDLDGFIADFEKARKHYRNIIGLQLGDEMKSSHGEPGLKHMRQIRDWIVNHPEHEETATERLRTRSWTRPMPPPESPARRPEVAIRPRAPASLLARRAPRQRRPSASPRGLPPPPRR